MNDAELVDLLAKVAMKDSVAFERLYKLASPKMNGLLVSMLRDQEVVHEALQEAFIQIWNKAGEYRPDMAKPMTWMVAIARYRALDMLRKHRPDPTDLDDIAHLLKEDPTTAREDRMSLDVCLNELTDAQRECISLVYYGGYTHAEISDLMNTPLGTVKSWVRRGLSSLKRCLNNELPEA